MLPDIFSYRLYAEQLCQYSRFRSRVSQEAAWLLTTLGLVAGNIGVSLLPANAKNLQCPGLRYVKLKGRQLYFLLQQQLYLSRHGQPSTR